MALTGTLNFLTRKNLRNLIVRELKLMNTTATVKTSEDTTRPSMPSKPKSKAVCELCHTRRPILKVRCP